MFRNTVWLFLLALLLLPGCRPCDPQTFDMGALSADALAMVPYSNDEKTVFKHSNGKLIYFTVERNTYQRTEHMCAECCDILKFEEDITRLMPDQKVIQPELYISNADSTYIVCYIRVNQSSFQLPVHNFELEMVEMLDTMKLGTKEYYNVFCLEYQSGFYSPDTPIYIDSLYYNFDFGILKITLSNDEFYQLDR